MLYYYLFLALIFEVCSIIYLDKFILDKKPKLINHLIFLLLFCTPCILFLVFTAELTSQNQENEHAKQQNYQHNNE
jgi:hypothetical protein